jgi:hypothetical protein
MFAHRTTTLLATCLTRFITAIVSSQLLNATATRQLLQ